MEIEMGMISVPVGTYNYHYPTSGVIVVIAEIPQAFQHAHHAIIAKRGIPTTGQWLKTMKQLWWEEYGVTVIKDWFALEFATEQELTMFLLRWS